MTKLADLLNITDGNTIAVTRKSSSYIEKEFESAVNWFKLNHMFAKQLKSQTIIFSKRKYKKVSILPISSKVCERSVFAQMSIF